MGFLWGSELMAVFPAACAPPKPAISTRRSPSTLPSGRGPTTPRSTKKTGMSEALFKTEKVCGSSKEL